MYDAFTQRDTVVIAVAQEDTALKAHAKFLKTFGSGPPFDIVADLNRKKTTAYDRITAYLIDKHGKVYYKATWADVDHLDKALAELVTADDPSRPVEPSFSTQRVGTAI